MADDATENALVGISVRADDPELGDLAANIDAAERLGVDSIELPTLAMDLVAGGQVMRDRLDRAKRIVGKRRVRLSAHGPIAINLMGPPHLLKLHETVLHASLIVAAELGATRYVLHTGISPLTEAADLAAAYEVQRACLARAGDAAKALGLLLVVENVFTYERKRRTALPSELARELAAVAHSNVRACFDVSHGMINASVWGADFLTEAEVLAPLSNHLHVHDSFGWPTEITTYSRAERIAFGQGDLHLPIGWGNMPWQDLFRRCRFPRGCVLNIELEQRHWAHAAHCVAAARELAAQVHFVDAA